MSDSRKKQAEQIPDENIAKVLGSKSDAELEKYVDDFCTELVRMTKIWGPNEPEFNEATQEIKTNLINYYNTGINNNNKLLTFVQLIPYMYHYINTYLKNKNIDLKGENLQDMVQLSFDIAVKENLDTIYYRNIFAKENNFLDLEIDFLEQLKWNTGMPAEEYRKSAFKLGFISEEQLHDIKPQEKILNEKIQSLEQLEEKEKENIKEKFNNAIQRLLTEKKDVDTLYQSGMTPLMYASYLGHKQAVDLLLKNKANVNLGTPGRTPLRYAMTGENIEVIQALLEAKADIDEQTSKIDDDIPYYITPLIAATESGQTKVVETLLTYKADIKKTDSEGDTALHYATRLGHREITDKLLEKNADVNETNSIGDTPLITAASKGQDIIVKELLDRNADIEKTSNDEDTALHQAASRGSAKTVDILLSYKADFNKQNSSNQTPLIVAAKTGHADVVERLLIADDKKSVINHVDNEHNSALMHAARKGRTKIVKVLLKYKADVNQGIDGRTALRYAAKEGVSVEIVKALLDAKANWKLIDKNKKTPLKYAEENKHEAIIELLEEKLKSEIMTAIASKHQKLEPWLFYASKKGWTDLVNYLLTKNADIDNKNQKGLTAFDYAKAYKRDDIAELLQTVKLYRICNSLDAITLSKTPSKDQYVTQRRQLKELIQLSKKEFNEAKDLNAKENIYQKLVEQAKKLAITSTTPLSDTLSKVGLYKEKMEEPEDFVSQVNTVLKKLG